VRRHRDARNGHRAPTSARRISLQVGNETARLRSRAVRVAQGVEVWANSSRALFATRVINLHRLCL